MIKIIALNEEIDSEANSDDEIRVTKEAEETIAVSEYMRALKYKADKDYENAMILFTELLETTVLNELSAEDKENKLYSVRYNCHKNIAYIYEEKKEYEQALENYMKALELDDTEVFMMNRMGQLALKLEKWDLAEYVFQKCLARNPNHWAAADGVLDCLCKTGNIMGSYGWALKLYLKDNDYIKAEDVLIEITETFEDVIPFFEKVWPTPFTRKSPKTNVRKKSVFPGPNPNIKEENEKLVKPALDKFKADALNWLTVGKFIVSLYNHLMETKQCPVFILAVSDIYEEEDECSAELNGDEFTKVDQSQEVNNITINSTVESGSLNDNLDNKTENEAENFVAPNTIDNNVDVVDSPNQIQEENNEETENPKSETEIVRKPRRRCSDLSFLEQWGWHKNKRYSSRKRSQQDKPENDTTMNGYLRKIFSKDFDENFDKESPFLPDKKGEEIVLSKKQEEYSDFLKKNVVSWEEFHSSTEADFQDFVKELKNRNFDLYCLLFIWLKYISKYWEQSFTQEIKDIYYEIYKFYINHYDLQTWNLLSNDDFNASFRMALLYLEIDIEKQIEKSKSSCTIATDSTWRTIFWHLKFNSGIIFVISDEAYEKNIIRLVWLDYCAAKLESNWNKCVECLQHLERLIEQQDEKNFVLKFPNLKQNNYIDLESVKSTCVNIQRRISLINVKNLYDNQNYKELCEILKESLIYSTEIRNSDDSVLKIQTQFEVLLESLWNSQQYEDCMIWSERCLCYAVRNLLDAPTDTYRYEEWAKSCNFILIYLEELLLPNPREILDSIKKYTSRLVQSISKILTHQFDIQFNKNNNPPHPVDCKRTWVILHQILLVREEKNPVFVKPKSQDGTISIGVEENIEEMLPKTFSFLFTAHEYLGRRFWCTRDGGLFLLYILDFVIPKIRLPLYDSIRDVVVEYVEQLTYCLFGYPAKKARSKHIEEHDAKNIDITFELAVKIFDFYRPEILPEFNSYKLDSISSDFEALLLKILPLIPKECDPTDYSKDIREFVIGQNFELPEEGFDKLPFRIKYIFYLLGDFYFKNRDLQKSIKYYILDLTCEPKRFDSWAGIALSKQSRLDTKLNSCTAVDFKECLDDADSTKRCFEQCISINKTNTLLWIEYGQFAYTVHSFCSRLLKHCMTLSMEQFSFIESVKENYLQTAQTCFITADKTIKEKKDPDVDEDDEETHDEKWLHHFMLGKIAEKRKEHPKIYLDHYLMAANLLHENNATYPIKINHNNPSTLSIEALEVFYRTSSSIIKYLEQNKEVRRDIGKLFQQVLKELAGSPFAYNQAKINDSSINAYKRKLAAEKAEALAKKQKLEEKERLRSERCTKQNSQEQATVTSTTTISNAPMNDTNVTVISTTKIEQTTIESSSVVTSTTNEITNESNENKIDIDKSKSVDSEKTSSGTELQSSVPHVSDSAPLISVKEEAVEIKEELSEMNKDEKNQDMCLKVNSRSQTPVQNVENIQSEPGSPSRRGSQESSATTTTTTGTSSSSSSSESSSSSSDSSSEESDSGGSTEDENEKHDENEPFTFTELEPIYKSCVKNLEECVTRFPEHYKSIYRLVHHYLNAPDKLKNMQKCHQLLIGNYTTSLGNHIAGLFSDRKNNNFFNGIWRIPSSEIDRPGSFSTHLVKCVNILLEVLRKDAGHSILIDMALQLHRTPDQDKRYIRDFERKELCKQAMAFCVQVMRDILKKNQENRNDSELVELLLDVYKAHKKCIKHMNQKEALFSQLLVDTYKFYMEDKVKKLPETCNLSDIAIRFCVQEISRRKTIGKYGGSMLNSNPDTLMSNVSSMSGLTTTQISINELNNLQQGITSRVTSPAAGFSDINSNTIVQQQIAQANLLHKNAGPYVIGRTPTPPMNKPPTTQLAGVPSRPRGRPVGSNKNSPSISTPNLLNTPPHAAYPMDASSIAALMAFYGNPALPPSASKDTKFMNNFFSEFYKFLGASSAMNPTPTAPIASHNMTSPLSSPITPPQKNSNSTVIINNAVNPSLSVNQQQKNNVNSSNIVLATSQFPPQPTLSSSPKLPQFDIKNLIASAASQVAQTTQSASATITVGSGELTITPANTKSPNLGSSKNIGDLPTQKGGKSSPALSVTKVNPQKSPGLISVKPLSDLTGPPKPSIPNISKLPILPDLPKSLTITPAMSTLHQQPVLQVPSSLNTKQQKQSQSGGGKIKSRKTSTVVTDLINNPYKRPPSAGNTIPNQAESFLNPMAIATQMQYPGSSNFNASTLTQQASLLNAYADMLKQVGLESNKDLLAQITKSLSPNFTTDKGNTKKSASKSNKALSVAKPSIPQRTSSNSSNQNASGISVPIVGNVPAISPISSSPTNKFSLPSSQLRTTSFADAFVASLNNNSGQSCYNRPGSTPSPSTQVSPTKTLQQKLAEQKQKANQMIAKNSAGSSSGNQKSSKSSNNDIDIIVLD
ncbi:calcineurin-binding protein cabin-1-like [Condylostylus longicornis]|uniref:calcineurin-binding protein cabin-1-like n=1 Tax=Condylostylus longicornis TaxID=2530218 RepID=UPI00244DD928|nr:calcineurin-binding protein cabin-1-like [Condylostylus longicornis]